MSSTTARLRPDLATAPEPDTEEDAADRGLALGQELLAELSDRAAEEVPTRMRQRGA